jgi:hypothetical protein
MLSVQVDVSPTNDASAARQHPQRAPSAILDELTRWDEDDDGTLGGRCLAGW